MDHLWSPWRYQYISKNDGSSPCIFCAKPAASADRENLIVHRGTLNFVILNLYPYTSGHLMIAPFAHVGSLSEADGQTLVEMISLAQQAEGHLRSIYSAPGFNLGLNIGSSAGAGVAGHIHMHVLPRWPGDANFLSTIGETRVLPEDLNTTYSRLAEAFRSSKSLQT